MLAEIVRRLEPADLAERMVERFRAGIAGYQRLPDTVISGQILDVSRRNVELFLDSLTNGRAPDDADLELFRSSARARATEGMQLEDLLAAYRQGGRLGWQAIREAARPGEENAVMLAGELLMQYVDRVSAAVAQTYLDERQHLVSEEERKLRDLMSALSGAQPLTAALRELAERLRLPLRDEYVAWSFTIPGAPARDHAAVASSLRGVGALGLTEGDRVTGIAAADLAPDVLARRGGVLALGDPTPRTGLAEALDDARLLLDLAHRLELTGVVRAGDWLPELLLARSPRHAARLAAGVLGPLEPHSDGRTDLGATLAVFIACDLDRQSAAARLHVHPNTLDYRLRRITELTGLRLSEPRGVLLATLAVRQRALAP